MAEREARRTAHDLLGEPHVAGRRISVRQLAALVEDRGDDPETVAERFDLDIADVYHALAYYHDHPTELREVDADRDAALDVARETVDRLVDADSDADDVASYLGVHESTRTANDWFGEEDMAEWLPYAVEDDAE